MNEAITDRETATINTEALGDLLKRVKKLNRRAAKLGVAPLTIETGETHQREKKDPQTGLVSKRWTEIDVTITGPTPKLEGYTLLAVVVHEKVEGGYANIVNVVPGQEVNDRSHWTAAPTCDHCKTRRYRKETFLVRHTEGGDVLRVGRQCIADFLGGVDPKHLLAMAKFFTDRIFGDRDDEESWGWGGGWVESRTGVENLLVLTAAAIRIRGWCSRGAARNDDSLYATADRIREHLYPPNPKPRRWEDPVFESGLKDRETVTDTDRERGSKALAWARSLDVARLNSDYLLNVASMARKEWVVEKDFGILCSIVSAWDRETKRAERAKQESAEFANSTFVGEPKKRSEYQVRILKVVPIDGTYGVSYLHRMLDENGNLLVWFSSNTRFEEGAELRVKATVKKHETYREVKQTIVTRVTAA